MTSLLDSTVQVIIAAQDKASKVVGDINVKFSQLNSSVGVVNKSLNVFSTTLSAASLSGAVGLGRLAQAIVNVNKAIYQSTTGRTIIDTIKEAAEEAATETQELSAILGSLSSTAGIFGKNFVGIEETPVLKNLDDRFERIGQKISQDLLPGLVDSGIKALAPLDKGITDLLQSIGPKVPQFLLAPVRKVFGEGVANSLKEGTASFSLFSGLAATDLDALGRQLDSLLADVVLEKLIANKVPSALRPALQGLFGQDFFANIGQGIKVSPFANLFSGDAARSLLEGSAGKAFETFLTTRLQRGFNVAFTKLNASVADIFGSLGAKAGDSFLGGRGGAPNFDIADALFGGQLTATIDAIGPKISRTLAENSGADKFVTSFVATLFQSIPATIGAGILSGGIGQLLFGNAAAGAAGLTSVLDNFVLEVIKALDKGFIGGFANIITSVTKLNEAVILVVEKGLNAVIPRALRSIIGSVAAIPLNIAQEAIAGFQQVAPFIEAFFPGLLGKIQGEVARRVSEITTIVGTAIQGAFSLIGEGTLINIDPQELAKAVATGFVTLDNFLEGLLSDSFNALGQTASTAFAGGFTRSLASKIAPAIDLVDNSIRELVNRIGSISGRLQAPLQGVGQVSGALAGLSEPVEVFQQIKAGASTVFGKLSDLGQELTFFQNGLATLQQLVVGGPFDLLIGQNVRLREQLLATQSSLVATNKVIDVSTGVEFADPGAAIESLTGPVEEAINRVRTQSLDLVGVTSSQLVEPFQIIAGLSSSINIGLDESADLTVDFAAALGTLGIPLFQARQEITSILQGTIDQNSVLAKSIGITNEQIKLYKSQGRVFEELTKRLGAFRAGNALAAKTINGLTSNIQEVFEIIALEAGKPLIEPIVEELQSVYDFLTQNQEAISDAVGRLVGELFSGVQNVFAAIKNLLASGQQLFVAIPEFLVESATNGLNSLAKAIDNTVNILSGALSVIGQVAEIIRPISGPLLDLALQAKVLQTGIGILGGAFGTFAKILPGVGELLFGIELRMLPLVNLFPSLTSQLGLGAGGFLALGKSLNDIPGAAALVTRSLQGVIGPFAPVVTNLIPLVAGLGVQIVGLSRVFPPLQTAINGILASNPGKVIEQVSSAIKAFPLAQQIPGINLFTNALDQAAGRVTVMAQGQTVAAFATTQFKVALKAAAIAARNFLVNMALLAGGVFLAFKAVDEFILKNEGLKEILSQVFEGLAAIGQFIQEKWIPIIAGAATVVGTLAISMSGVTIQVARLVALKLAGWAVGAAGALAKLEFVLKAINATKLAATIGQLGTGLRALALFAQQGTAATQAFLATQGILVPTVTASGAAATGAAAGFKVLAVSIGAAIAPLLALLAPIALVTAALVGIGLVIRNGIDIGDRELIKGTADFAAEATSIYNDTTSRVIDASLNDISRINRLLDEQAEKRSQGIALSEEEVKQNKFALRVAKVKQNRIDAEIKSLREAKEAGGVVDEEIDEQIARLERTRVKLRTAITNISTQIEPKDLPELGTRFDQLTQKVNGAIEAIQRPSGDTEIFKQQAQNLIDLTQSQIEQGQITQGEAIRRFNLIATNTQADLDLQQKAQQALTALYETEGKRQAEAIAAREAEIQAAIASGATSEIAGQQELLALKQEALEQELDTARIVHLQKMAFLDTELLQVRQNAQANLKDLQTKAQELEGDDLESNLEEQALVRSKLADTERQIEGARLESQRQFSNQRLQLEAKAQQGILDAERKVGQARISSLEKQQQLELDTIAAGQAELEAAIATGSVGEIEGEQQLAQLRAQQVQTQIAGAQEVFAQKQELLDKELELIQRNAQAELERLQSQAEGLEGQDLTANLEQQEQIQKQLEQAEQNFNKKRNRLTQEFSNEQTKLRAQEERQAIESAKRVQDARLRVLEREQDKALDLVREAANARSIAAQEEFNLSRDQTKLDAASLDNKRRQITQELAAERDRIRELEQLARSAPTAKAEEEIQGQIRDARLKTQEFTLALLENEAQAQDNLLAQLRRRLEQENLGRQNQIEAQNQALQRQAQTYKQIEATLSRQNQLLQSAQSLQSAASDFAQTEIDILVRTEKSELRRRQLAEAQAAIKLRALQQQQKFERESLELEQRKTALALEQEQIQNRIAQAQQVAQIAEAQSELEIAKADPASTEAQIRALELRVSSAALGLQSLQDQGQLLEDRAATQEELFGKERQGLEFRQRSQQRQSQFELAESIRSPGARAKAFEKIQNDIAQGFGAENVKELRKQLSTFAGQGIAEQFGGDRKGRRFDRDLRRRERKAEALTLPKEFFAQLPKTELKAVEQRRKSNEPAIAGQFEAGVKQFAGVVEQLSNGEIGATTNYNITVNANPQRSIAGTQTTSSTPTVEEVIRRAKQLVG